MASTENTSYGVNRVLRQTTICYSSGYVYKMTSRHDRKCIYCSVDSNIRFKYILVVIKTSNRKMQKGDACKSGTFGRIERDRSRCGGARTSRGRRGWWRRCIDRVVAAVAGPVAGRRSHMTNGEFATLSFNEHYPIA